ncbi:peptidoglycan-binding protein [Nostoc sp. CENA67]|uniref:Peptidoglycan-binding protein n=1 Tax=Amazonocrinis nigriterrae CENA67 TaxID=2794033 RepID=A0A8J7HTT7_9NOST|nr:peptidoglycan-binding domain-containing protein [Amazonocrinis nigriterrae]MBH8564030.1 peptidoglycan-binding protein [Amazonocrinis nigriterrae CENA67]
MTTYTNAQFRSILFGLGYLAKDFANPALGFPVTTDNSPFTGNKTLQAIRNFQADYGLLVDGIVGAKTMAKVEEVIKILQYELNVVVNAGLPKDQPFYGPKTVQAVKKFEAQYYGKDERFVTGVATLELRKYLDAIAKQIA